MSTSERILMSAIILALGAPANVAIAQAGDPAMGTWVLNVAKSKYESGPPLKSQTRTYTPVPNGYRFVADATNAAGEKAHSDFTAYFDNKYHAITGNSNVDSLMITRIDKWTVETLQKKGSTIVTFASRKISQDGKTLTNTSRGVGNDARPYENVEVFDKK